LSGDDHFDVDDRLPIVLPRPKTIGFGLSSPSPFATFFERFLASVDAASTASARPDIVVRVFDSKAPPPERYAIEMLADDSSKGRLLGGDVVAAADPLTADLNWSGLLCRESAPIPAQPGDRALVWYHEHPLVLLRPHGGGATLVVAFDLRSSNAARLPAFVLLLHRFVEQVRTASIGFEARNVETNQALTVASNPTLPAPRLFGGEDDLLRAPSHPGFFEVKQADQTLLRAAAQFSDPRQADFQAASAFDGLSAAVPELAEENSEPDFLAPVWALALGGVMIGSWTWRRA
jgi:hypothetical protein